MVYLFIYLFLTGSRLYAFDVHCNSFFPMFVLLYGKYDEDFCLFFCFPASMIPH